MIITLLLSKISHFQLKMHSHRQCIFWSTVIVLRVAFALSLLADKLLEKLGLCHTPWQDCNILTNLKWNSIHTGQKILQLYLPSQAYVIMWQ